MAIEKIPVAAATFKLICDICFEPSNFSGNDANTIETLALGYRWRVEVGKAIGGWNKHICPKCRY